MLRLLRIRMKLAMGDVNVDVDELYHVQGVNHVEVIVVAVGGSAGDDSEMALSETTSLAHRS